jgi:hypothetical protein
VVDEVAGGRQQYIKTKVNGEEIERGKVQMRRQENYLCSMLLRVR